MGISNKTIYKALIVCTNLVRSATSLALEHTDRQQTPDISTAEHVANNVTMSTIVRSVTSLALEHTGRQQAPDISTAEHVANNVTMSTTFGNTTHASTYIEQPNTPGAHYPSDNAVMVFVLMLVLCTIGMFMIHQVCDQIIESQEHNGHNARRTTSYTAVGITDDNNNNDMRPPDTRIENVTTRNSAERDMLAVAADSLIRIH